MNYSIRVILKYPRTHGTVLLPIMRGGGSFNRIMQDGTAHGTAIDIGTSAGLSAAAMALYFDAVYTFDVRPVYGMLPFKIWEHLGLSKKIVQCYTRKRQLQQEVVAGIHNLVFAFIDGSHSYKSATDDYNMTKRCGRVLFHDYWSVHPNVKKAVDDLHIPITVSGRLAYWKGEPDA